MSVLSHRGKHTGTRWILFLLGEPLDIPVVDKAGTSLTDVDIRGISDFVLLYNIVCAAERKQSISFFTQDPKASKQNRKQSHSSQLTQDSHLPHTANTHFQPIKLSTRPKMVEFTVFKGSKDGSIVKGTTKKEIGPNEVLVKVTHSGLCGTDTHYTHVDMTLGHEGAGIVEEIGQDVTLFKKGDRAGWGYVHGSCGHCKQCLRGAETFCPERRMYSEADLDQGSMATHGVWREDFLFRIPDSMRMEDAAPLMCGGATVFNALQFHGVKSTDRVGVIGIGGLGHLAIQFAAKMGCEVVVFSGTDSKREEAMKLGATEFHATKGQKEIKIDGQIDHLLVTTSAQPDWDLYLSVMAPSGTIYPLTVSNDDLKIPYMPIIMGGLKVQGSLVAARQIHREMLNFAAVHDIRPIIQTFPLSIEGINDAFESLEGGKMRYRGVLVA